MERATVQFAARRRNKLLLDTTPNKVEAFLNPGASPSPKLPVVGTDDEFPLLELWLTLTYNIIMGALHGRTLGQLRCHEIDGVRKEHGLVNRAFLTLEALPRELLARTVRLFTRLTHYVRFTLFLCIRVHFTPFILS